jgi:hypothetical protein
MHRMEHIHGKLLAEDGEKVVLESLDGYLGCHDRPHGGKTYFGYFEVPPNKTKGLELNSPYRLILNDGRSGDIFADIRTSPLSGVLVAEFHVTGELHR